MALIVVPPGLLCPSDFKLHRVSAGFSSRSQVTQGLQIRPLIGWYWAGSMQFPKKNRRNAAKLEALLHAWGVGDHIYFGHLDRPIPKGTLRETTTLSFGYVAGQSLISLSSANGQGKTLLAGDCFGLDGVLYMVLWDVTFSNATPATASVQLVAPLRKPVDAGTQIELINPTIPWVRTSQPAITYGPGGSQSAEITFEEYSG